MMLFLQEDSQGMVRNYAKLKHSNIVLVKNMYMHVSGTFTQTSVFN